MSDYSIVTDDGMPPMSDPIAFFITWSTYGTWLPGDARGWIEFQHGWKLPEPPLALECAARMSETPCLLDASQRETVEKQVAETCGYRGWTLHAANCRSNHGHVVVTAAGTDSKKIRVDLKAWCTRRLKENDPGTREHWWADRGSIRWVWNQTSLATVVEYTTEGQERKDRDRS